MRFAFSQIGLEHILGVSGFHFAALAAVFSFFLSFFLKSRPKWLILLILLNAYYLFLGFSPAVQRCYLMASAYLIAKWVRRPVYGLNLLAVTLTLELLFRPLIAANIGFQLSFASCFGIFLLQPLFDRALQSLLPKRFPAQTLALPFFAKHIDLLSRFLRKTLSVGFAVNLALLPILFHHFHSFSPLGLFYNLFYPLCADGLLFFLLLASILHLLFPLLAPPLFFIIGWLSARLLDLASYPPIILQAPLFSSPPPSWLIPIYFFILFHLSQIIANKQQNYN